MRKHPIPQQVFGVGILTNCINLLYILFLLFNHSAYALVYNVTIDDQSGDPTNNNRIQYTPQDEWIIGQNCTDCDLNPNSRSHAYHGTWMNATYRTSGLGGGHIKQASVTFEGIAVYVVCITISANKTDDGINDITFAIDGLTSNSFEKVPVSSNVTTFDFNQTVFSKTGLSNTSHTLLIQAGLKNQKSVILLDSIIYTKDDGGGTENGLGSQASKSKSAQPSSTNQSVATANKTQGQQYPTHQVPDTIIFAGVTGAAFAILCGFAAFIYYLRRRRRVSSSSRKRTSSFISAGSLYSSCSSPSSSTSSASQTDPPSESYYTRTSYFSSGYETNSSPRVIYGSDDDERDKSSSGVATVDPDSERRSSFARLSSTHVSEASTIVLGF